jgi:phosphotransferase system HPr (HPr) family protein
MKHPSVNTDRIEREVTVRNRHKGYVWPAATFVRLMNRFHCDVRVGYDGKEVDGTSVLALLELAPPAGSKVRIRVEGRDAANAMQEIDKLVQSLGRIP